MKQLSCSLKRLFFKQFSMEKKQSSTHHLEPTCNPCNSIFAMHGRCRSTLIRKSEPGSHSSFSFASNFSSSGRYLYLGDLNSNILVEADVAFLAEVQLRILNYCGLRLTSKMGRHQ